jgi:Domain of unknown function (DUF4157)
MKIDAETAKRLQHWFPDLDMQRVTLINAWPMNAFVKDVLRQGAMTIAPFVFYGKAHFTPGDSKSISLLAHELKHVEQYHSMGYLGFFKRYFLDKARNGFEYSKTLPLEKEAYDLQAEVLKELQKPD